MFWAFPHCRRFLGLSLPIAIAGLALCLAAGTSHADEVTPTQGATDQAESPPADQVSAISYEDQARMLTGVYPLSLDRMEQVTQHSYNWRGMRDASLGCELGFTPQAIVVRGRIVDDQPFVQPIAYPAKPDWWQVTYAADGVELTLEDPTSATNRLRVILNFSSAGLSPKVQVMEAPLIENSGVLTSADFQIRSLRPEDVPVNLPDTKTPVAGFRFEAAIPTTGLAEPKFFSGPLRMSVRLHDLDGEVETYLRMEEVVEKRE